MNSNQILHFHIFSKEKKWQFLSLIKLRSWFQLDDSNLSSQFPRLKANGPSSANVGIKNIKIMWRETFIKHSTNLEWPRQLGWRGSLDCSPCWRWWLHIHLHFTTGHNGIIANRNKVLKSKLDKSLYLV